MKRFTAALAAGAAALALCTAGPASAQIEGRYQKLPTPQPTSDPHRIEVVEVFWYGCPHCFRFQPYVEEWRKSLPADVHFAQLPAVFNDEWEVHARAYYTAVSLGILEEVHPAFFAALHVEGRRLATMDAVRGFFVEQGVSEADFDRHSRSFTVTSGIKRSLVMQSRYRLRGVPAMVVNGKYLVSAQMAGGHPEVLEVVDALVVRERAAARG